MQKTLISSFLILALSSCGSPKPLPSGVTLPSKADQKEARSKNAAIQKEAFKTARVVNVEGREFTVARVPGSYSANVIAPGQENLPIGERQAGPGYIDRPFALVELKSPAGASYSAAQVEAAARAGTGCDASFAAGVLAFAGGVPGDLQALDAKKKSSVRGWRANLTC